MSATKEQDIMSQLSGALAGHFQLNPQDKPPVPKTPGVTDALLRQAQKGVTGWAQNRAQNDPRAQQWGQAARQVQNFLPNVRQGLGQLNTALGQQRVGHPLGLAQESWEQGNYWDTYRNAMEAHRAAAGNPTYTAFQDQLVRQHSAPGSWTPTL